MKLKLDTNICRRNKNTNNSDFCSIPFDYRAVLVETLKKPPIFIRLIKIFNENFNFMRFYIFTNITDIKKLFLIE